MKRFFKSFVLAICSLSLFGCSGFHELGNAVKEEEPGQTEITFDEFKAVADGEIDYINNLQNVLDSMALDYKTYEDGEMINHQYLSAHIIDGTLKPDDPDDAGQKGLVFAVIFLGFIMPSFAQLVSEKELSEDYMVDLHYYELTNGDYRAKGKNLDLLWDGNGLIKKGDAIRYKDDAKIRENFEFTYTFK